MNTVNDLREYRNEEGQKIPSEVLDKLQFVIDNCEKEKLRCPEIFLPYLSSSGVQAEWEYSEGDKNLSVDMCFYQNVISVYIDLSVRTKQKDLELYFDTVEDAFLFVKLIINNNFKTTLL